MARASFVPLVAALGLAAACHRVPSPEAPEGQDADRDVPAASQEKEQAGKPSLPPSLADLDLSEEQRTQVLALMAELERDAAPVIDATRGLGRALAGAARQCKGESPFVDSEVSTVIGTGEQIRGKVLDGVQRLHAILTPAQRRALSQRLLDADDPNKRKSRNESRTRSLGDEIDLSFMQMISVLAYAQRLRSDYEEKLAPWRTRYRNAVADFAKDDFDARSQPVAEVPLFAIGTDIARDALRVLVPLLDPPQCQALGRYLDQLSAQN